MGAVELLNTTNVFERCAEKRITMLRREILSLLRMPETFSESVFQISVGARDTEKSLTTAMSYLWTFLRRRVCLQRFMELANNSFSSVVTAFTTKR